MGPLTGDDRSTRRRLNLPASSLYPQRQIPHRCALRLATSALPPSTPLLLYVYATSLFLHLVLFFKVCEAHLLVPSPRALVYMCSSRARRQD